jgi:NADH:ubiquinone oxidoreductase subunit F (NADH-binding)/(2Fe-2S) ferredoxin/NAD-dependent dihydropyrimidine dehydrogenase PreA subunit
MNIEERYRTQVDSAMERLAEQTAKGDIVIEVGSATCENAAGAAAIYHEFAEQIRFSNRTDIQLKQSGCTGRCSREPIVTVCIPGQLPLKYQKVDPLKTHRIFAEHVLGEMPVTNLLLDGDTDTRHKREYLFWSNDRNSQVLAERMSLFRRKLEDAEIDLQSVCISETSNPGLGNADGMGSDEIRVLVRPDQILYRINTPEDLEAVFQQHHRNGQIVERLRISGPTVNLPFLNRYADIPFFRQQTRIALRNSGIIDPENMDTYLAQKGYTALSTVLEKNDPDWVIEQLERSHLRGRGGGGYSTSMKWKLTREAKGDTRYVICNADEGDPGAFMDRSMLEGDPFAIIEGMTIAGFTIGAKQGYFYVRAEYPLAVRRLENAMAQARNLGLLGDRILGTDYSFDLEIRLGAGAFVCGEETALINSIEGRRGQPRIRPPYPSEAGLFGQPTLINNVETFANIPVLLSFGADWFASIGTPSSGGTKVFALAGKVQHTGLVEVPMGTTLKEIVFGIGGGSPEGKTIKAIQTGGPAGGCIRMDFLDTPVDFDTLLKAGSMMGSGGMIVLDEDDCMVDIAKFFLTFSQNESCGKCTSCREGTTRMLEILDRITSGKGTTADLEKLERLALLLQKTSLCGLGRAAPNPVLSTLRYFPEEYQAHVHEKRCPAKKCTALIRYTVIPDACVGCRVCARNCPVNCIEGERKKAHFIVQEDCIQCGRCFEVCKFAAIERG